MEKEITTSDVSGTRGVKPNANVQSAVAQLWDIIRKAGEALIAVRSDNAGLTARLAIVQGELYSYKERIAGLDQERENSRSVVAMRDEELQALRTALEQAEQTTVGQRAMMEEYADRMERYEETIRRLTIQVDTQATEIDTLQKQNGEYEAFQVEVEQSRTDVHTLTQTVASLQGQLATATKVAQDADYLRAEVVRRNTELHARIKEALEHKERVAELENKVFELGALQTAVQQAKEQLQTVQSEYAAALLAREEAEQRAEQREQQHTELQALLEKSRVVEGELLARMQQLHDDNDTYRSLAEEQQQHVIELSEQVLQLKAAMPQYEESSAVLKERITELQQQLQQAERENATTAEHQKVVLNEKEAIESVLRQTTDECEHLRTTCAALRQELQDIAKGAVSKEFIEEKEAQLAELRSQLHDKGQEVEKMQRQLDAAYNAGSLFTSGTSANERDAVIASVEALLQKVEHVLEADSGEKK